MTERPYTSVWSDLHQVEFSQGFIAGRPVPHPLPARRRRLQADPADAARHHRPRRGLRAQPAAHAEHFYVWAIDFIGHGYSSQARTPAGNQALHRPGPTFLDAIGVDKAYFTGESLGGWVTARFAIDHPERVERIVLNTMGGTMANPKVMERLYTLSMEAAKDPSWERVKTRLEWLMADPAMVTDDLIRTRQAIFQQPDWLKACETNMALQDPETRRRNMLTDDDLRPHPGARPGALDHQGPLRPGR